MRVQDGTGVATQGTPSATPFPETNNGCTAEERNGNGDAYTLTVPAGKRASVQWWFDYEPLQQSIFEEGKYLPRQGVNIGPYLVYPDCPYAAVKNQAVEKNSTVTPYSAGFKKIE